ncbi:uncharacterized protein LOC125196978 [Salvia hispanica]|uniref:uncharacterized protein LOC125196978 n=1 Tax=Salvia hispanica TaxID=49212 RepID=UPI00200979C8|nr:uncharacterized protein LOC125196978 [Salvia hispanica]
MADGLRRVARAYYERSSEEQRDEAKDFFTRLDLNDDERISLEEFKACFPSGEEFFNKLDSSNTGFLDFSDVLVVFYHQKKALISISRCDGCHQKIIGPYFSCVLCLDHFPSTYDLCCDCHRGGKFEHRHPLSFMLHDQAALVSFIQTKTQPAKSVMEELRAIAVAHFKASSEKTQSKAKQFFTAMDSDGDGKVEMSEFSSFMSKKGYKLTGNPDFFKKLDMDGNGSLDFWEVMTLNYIIQSGRPFCDCCGDFIPATFFSCVHCFKAGKKTFDLCLRCYQSNAFQHDAHPGGPKFLDNYTLLHSQHTSCDGLARMDVALNTLDLAVNIFTNL